MNQGSPRPRQTLITWAPRQAEIAMSPNPLCDIVIELIASGISAPNATMTRPIRAEAEGILRSSTHRLTITVITKERNVIQTNDMANVTRYRFSLGLKIRQSGQDKSIRNFSGHIHIFHMGMMGEVAESEPALSSRSALNSGEKSSTLGTDKRGYDAEDLSEYLSRKTDRRRTGPR